MLQAMLTELNNQSLAIDFKISCRKTKFMPSEDGPPSHIVIESDEIKTVKENISLG